MLKIVGTPIGNIEDISIRGIKELFSAKIVIAEDTRNFIKLRNLLAARFKEIINSLGLDEKTYPRLISYREENHLKVIESLIALLKDGDAILVSDAGLPGISDPGQRLIAKAIEEEIPIDVIPGAVAYTVALVISGFNILNSVFLGFLPKEEGKIIKLLKKHKNETIVIYESPFRIFKLLTIIGKFNPNLNVCCCNDLTKKFQKVHRGNVLSVLNRLEKSTPKGEWCVVISSVKD